MRPKRSRAASAVPMRQRVAATLASSVRAGRMRMSGNPDSRAAKCSRWLVLRSSSSIAPTTAAGAAERNASSIAHSVCVLFRVSTRIRRAGSRPRPLRPWPCRRLYWAKPRADIISSNGPPRGSEPRNAPSSATMKPKADGVSASVVGTTSCKAPNASPPCGKWDSRTGRPKARTCAWAGSPSSRGNRERNSCITLMRLHFLSAARGRVMAHVSVPYLRTKQEQCKESFTTARSPKQSPCCSAPTPPAAAPAPSRNRRVRPCAAPRPALCRDRCDPPRTSGRRATRDSRSR